MKGGRPEKVRWKRQTACDAHHLLKETLEKASNTAPGKSKCHRSVLERRPKEAGREKLKSKSFYKSLRVDS